MSISAASPVRTAAVPTPPYVRKYVWIPTELLHRAEEFLGEGGLSEYISEALQLKVQRDNLQVLASEIEAKHGPASGAEVQEWRRLLS